nr:MAG TPA: Protein of unknown function (DUF2680) [Caudoviricetes sp.]
MNNPFFNALGGGQMPGPMGGFPQLLQQFKQFKETFQGDPKAEVEKLLQSGRLTQTQLNQLQQMAKQFQSLME